MVGAPSIIFLLNDPKSCSSLENFKGASPRTKNMGPQPMSFTPHFPLTAALDVLL